MEVFDKKYQLQTGDEMDNYFEYALTPSSDWAKWALNLPLFAPIFKLAYSVDGRQRTINIFPTLQFLYSHHIQPEYITREVREMVNDERVRFGQEEPADFRGRFFEAVERTRAKGLLRLCSPSPSPAPRPPRPRPLRPS